MSLISKLFSFGGTKTSVNISAARERARLRVHKKDFSDTIPDNDPYRSGIDFVKGVHVTADHYDTSSMPLDAEQMKIINLMLEGFSPPIQHRATNHIGAPLNAVAGVPINLSAFDEFNVVADAAAPEYLDPGYEWPILHVRD